MTDNRTRISAEPWTAWAVSLEGMLEENGYYGVYNDSSGSPVPCEGAPVYVMSTPSGIGFENNRSNVNPEVGNTVWICRMLEGGSFPVGTQADDLIPILKGVLVKGGKEKNKPNRC